MAKTKTAVSENTLGIGIVTPIYDPLVDSVGWGVQLQKKLLRLAHLKNDDSLLDIGSGTGTFCVLAKKSKRTAKIAGIDPDYHVIQIAKEKAARQDLNIEYINSSAQKLPFKSGSLDIAVSSLAFHHMALKDKRTACLEIYRVLKPDGHFLLADFGPTRNPLIKLFFLFGELLGFENRGFASDNLAGKLPQLMRETGFKVRKVSRTRGIEVLVGTKGSL